MTHPLAQRLAAGAPDWAHRPMLAWDRDELSRRRPFVTASEWRAFSTIELPEIVGTAHPDYAGLSRTQLLECGERMPHNLARAAENPGYYTDDGPELPLMHYVGYAGGPLFVGRDGNYRTAIASCLLPLDHGTQHLAGVTIERHRHDAAAQDAYDELATLLAARTEGPAPGHPPPTRSRRWPRLVMREVRPGRRPVLPGRPARAAHTATGRRSCRRAAPGQLAAARGRLAAPRPDPPPRQPAGAAIMTSTAASTTYQGATPMLPVLGPACRALRRWLAGLLPARRQGDPSLPVLYLIAVLALAAGDIATRLGWGMAAGLLAVPVFALALHRASLAAFLLAAGLLGGIATAPQPPAESTGSVQRLDPARS